MKASDLPAILRNKMCFNHPGRIFLEISILIGKATHASRKNAANGLSNNDHNQ